MRDIVYPQMCCKHILGNFTGVGASSKDLGHLSTAFQLMEGQVFEAFSIRTNLQRQRTGATRTHSMPRWKRFSLQLEACAHTCNAAVSVIANHCRAGTQPIALELDTTRQKLREAR